MLTTCKWQSRVRPYRDWVTSSVCCILLQFAVCCSESLWQVEDIQFGRWRFRARPSVVCCSVLQCVAVCCSVLQHVAACSVLQWNCVASRMNTHCQVAIKGKTPHPRAWRNAQSLFGKENQMKGNRMCDEHTTRMYLCCSLVAVFLYLCCSLVAVFFRKKTRPARLSLCCSLVAVISEEKIYILSTDRTQCTI